ncbi:MAG TPA: glycine cleavage system protein GcvH [Chloroflexi bacterium]|nr:glycine cleavage system protein GcvH [Chloroflexota bacterium]
MEFDPDVRYLETHEWARKDGDEIVVGISDYAQGTLSDIVYVELPEVDDAVTKGDQLGVVESVKAAGDVYAPVSGTIVAVNEALEDTPELINQDPFGKGWLVRIKPSEPAEWETLLHVEAHKAVVQREESQ